MREANLKIRAQTSKSYQEAKIKEFVAEQEGPGPEAPRPLPLPALPARIRNCTEAYQPPKVLWRW